MKDTDYYRMRQRAATTRFEEKAIQFGIESLLAPSLDAIWQRYPDLCDSLMRLSVWGVKNFHSLPKSGGCVLLGLKPTGRFHLAYRGLFNEIKLWQSRGLEVLIVLGAGELRIDGMAESDTEQAISQTIRFLSDYLKLPTNPRIVIDSQTREWMNWELCISRFISMRKVRQLLGWDDSIQLANIRVASLMTTTFLVPQLWSATPTVTIVPVGVNEAPYLELTKLVCRQMEFAEPIATYRDLLPSITGKGRMSSRNVTGSVYLDDSHEVIANKLARAATGGRALADHKKLGGMPDKCTYLQLVAPTLSKEDLSATLVSCLAGLPCSECKRRTIPIALKDW